jgi:hypothetical protein
MRQNLITSLVADDEDKPLEALTELEDLDLYDNKIPRVEGLKGLSKLKSVLLTSLSSFFNTEQNIGPFLQLDQASTFRDLRYSYLSKDALPGSE